MAAASAFLIFELIVAEPASFASAVALIVLTVLATVWLAVIVVNTLRGNAWVRGAIVVWQVLQIAVAIGSFQGVFARPDVGWLLLVPSIAVLGLLFTPAVVAATARRES